MNYRNEDVRRQDRILSIEGAKGLFLEGEYGILSMVTEQGEGYGVPLNFVLDGEVIYFHGAPEGDKFRALHASKQVSFCIVGKTKLIPEQFTTAYESVIVKGTIALDLSFQERMHGLELIIRKYSPEYLDLGMKAAEKSDHRTLVYRLDIVSVSGKCKVC
ncbi:5-nitroimidazole antibiotic resistance protein [Macellibacteroides sp. HH-ZS]|nr:5-nitroimidazole antibiotic resistance protein [Macellibacteroides sp. HH-ZS]